MKTSITFDVDSDSLDGYTDQYIADLWHIAQANPAPFGDADACHFADKLGREIIKRFLATAPLNLWTHQGSHIASKRRMDETSTAEVVA